MPDFFITTPIYYANSLPHLGHLYTTVVADVIHRCKEQRGFDVLFLTGTDEHGINIQRSAEASGRTPQQQVDFVSSELRRMFREFGLGPESGGYDIFMRTTEPFHYAGVQHLWQEIAKNRTPKGRETIYKGFYEGWFCAPCAAYKTEDEYVLPVGADVPLCLIHDRSLELIAEESYFFRLSDYDDFLLREIEKDPDLIRPEARRNEVLSFIRGGLQDLSISRQVGSVSWGVPVPDDDSHVMYVWLDALSNYITALGYGSTDAVRFQKFWPSAVHIVGKDILRFHTVYWMSFLEAAKLPLPKSVFAHGMWLDGAGRKMGKTLGNVIEVDVLRRHFQTDVLRYFLMREMVFGQDGKFSYENLIDRANADLSGGLGNLVSRTVSMIKKYRGGVVPSSKISESKYIEARRAGLDPDGVELVSVIGRARDEFARRFDTFEISQALEIAWSVIARTDKMISDVKPWELIKDERQNQTLDAVLYRSAETLRWLAVMLYPVMPESSRAIFDQLGLADDVSSANPAELKWGGLEQGTATGKAASIFPRIDKISVMNEINTPQDPAQPEAQFGVPEKNAQPSESEEPDADYISIDDFLKVELRVGQVRVAERIPNTDKLLRFEIDLGEEKPRQILAGLAEYYEPEQLIGRKVVVVANLRPRKMRGLESQGMICAASLGDGDKPAIATFLEEVEVGARLK